MPKRRMQIAMTEAEQAAFLREGQTLQVASVGPHGYPHQAATWYALIDGKVHFTTYARSQKVQNLRRNPKLSVMVETGTSYDELRGLVIEGEADIIVGDSDLAARVAMMATARRPADPPAGPPDEQTRRVVAKRVVIRVNPVRVYSWDHRKLGGIY